MAVKQEHFRVIIDVGNGVCVNAPFKKKWTVDEWRRMSTFMDRAIRNHR